MRVLIIGGTGLISTAICAQLLARGDEVTVYNRGQRERRIPGQVRHIRGDRTAHAAFERQMAEAGTFDCVIDMICYHPLEAESDVRAFTGRTGHLVFCSTVDVYAKPASRYPYRENEPRRPLTEYGRNKRLCEDVFLAAHERGDLRVTIIRPAYTYGEGGSIVHTFGWGTFYLDRVRKGLRIIVHGDGQSLWVSCHIDDVARAFVNACGNSRASGRAYHVTGEEWLTWNQYHQGVAEALGVPLPELVHIPTDVLVSIAPRHAGVCADNFQFDNIFDNTAAREDLGFRLTVQWVEGVRRTVAWLDKHGRIEDSATFPAYDRIIDSWSRLTKGLAQELSVLDA
jgi:nucleoside-diphosphate-sugar epimerase